MRARMLVPRVAVVVTSAVLSAGCGNDSKTTNATPAASAKAAAGSGLIVYGAEKKGVPTQLYTIRPDGTGATQLTHLKAGEAVNPDWSRDGTKLTYEVGGDKGAGIWVADADGTNAHNLTPKGFQGQPSFSPDGKQIVFERDPGPGMNGVFLMNSDGSNVHRLTRTPFRHQAGCGCDTDPNFSPDGNTITFVRIKKDAELQALFAMDRDGTHVRALTPYTDDVAIKHAWSPDGKRIVITINANPKPHTSANAVTIAANGSDRKALTTFKDGQSAYVGSYSPDGKQIVMRVERGNTFSIATIPSGGGAIHKLTTGSTRPRFIDWGGTAAA